MRDRRALRKMPLDQPIDYAVVMVRTVRLLLSISDFQSHRLCGRDQGVFVRASVGVILGPVERIVCCHVPTEDSPRLAPFEGITKQPVGSYATVCGHEATLRSTEREANVTDPQEGVIFVLGYSRSLHLPEQSMICRCPASCARTISLVRWAP
jgi:hypothetical protein